MCTTLQGLEKKLLLRVLFPAWQLMAINSYIILWQKGSRLFPLEQTEVKIKLLLIAAARYSKTNTLCSAACKLYLLFLFFQGFHSAKQAEDHLQIHCYTCLVDPQPFPPHPKNCN